MSHVDDLGQGQQLLAAVERILAETSSLIAFAEDCHKRAAQSPAGKGGDEAVRALAAAEIIRHYSTRTAFSGGVAALPGLLPGIGTAVAVAGGALADLTFILKFEMEMALALSQLHGHDIRDSVERHRAFLLACVSTLDAKSGGDFLAELGRKSGWARTGSPSEDESKKLLLTALSRLAVSSAAKGLFRAIPIVGIAVSSTTNKLLTTQVGERCVAELSKRPAVKKGKAAARKPRAAGPGLPDDDDIVDAHIRK